MDDLASSNSNRVLSWYGSDKDTELAALSKEWNVLLTNPDVLALINNSMGNDLVTRSDNLYIFTSAAKVPFYDDRRHPF